MVHNCQASALSHSTSMAAYLIQIGYLMILCIHMPPPPFIQLFTLFVYIWILLCQHLKYIQRFNALSCLTLPTVQWTSQPAQLDLWPSILATLGLNCLALYWECVWRMKPGLDRHLPVPVSPNFSFLIIATYMCIIMCTSLCALAEITCPDLPDPDNGIVDIQDNTPSGMAIYRCNPGLSLIGSSRRMCNEDGMWSGEPPTCQGIV